MKLLTSVVIVAMAASAAAQSATTVQNVRTQLSGSKPGEVAAPAATPVTLSVKPVTPGTKPLPKANKPAAQVAKPAAVVPKVKAKAKAGVKPPQMTEKSAAASETTSKAIAASGRRDPFLSPIVERPSGVGGCAAGKKCLVPDQLRLQGIVTSAGGHIAVVVNNDNRAYFLHENDPIYNGVVTRINDDSVTFREQIKDVLGKPSTREVVKKINTPA